MERLLLLSLATLLCACGASQNASVAGGGENKCPLDPETHEPPPVVEGRPDLPEWVGCLSPPMAETRISSVFHDEDHTFLPGGHSGIDIPVDVGTMVFAPAPGRVVYARATKLDTNIVAVRIDPGVPGGGWEYRMVHLRHISVQKGERVLRGQVLGLSGGAENEPGSGPCTTGPHLHYSLRYKGALADPLRYTCNGYNDRN